MWVGPSALTASLICAFVMRHFMDLRVVGAVLVLVSLGFTAAQYRTWSLNTQMLNHWSRQHTITGEVVRIEHQPTGQRITLKGVDILGIDRVRLTTRGRLQPGDNLWPGQVVQIKAVLMPPGEPVAPGTYNFRQKAFFDGLGAVGFATSQPQVIKELTGHASKIAQVRQTITQKLRKGIDGHAGAIAAALITGDRAGISQPLHQTFADSGIAHILAISGLHLSIIAGLVFLLVRRGLCVIPRLALNHPTKKWAALISICATAAYLALCWGSVPAIRAFVMTTVVMGAIILDRTALSMRSVALAALMILLLWPESLISPSFQLSFAAVVGLIAVYESTQNVLLRWRARGGVLGTVWIYGIGMLGTTLIASLATMPYAIYTFNRFTMHGVLANLVAVPLTTLWIMPSALASVILMPFGFEGLTLPWLASGINYLITIAGTVAAWPGTVVLVAGNSQWMLGLATLGGLWWCLWQRPWRWVGAVVVAAALIVTPFSRPPDIYVAGDGKIVGVRGQDSLWLTSMRSGKFAREMWLRQSGLAVGQKLPKVGTTNDGLITCQGQLCTMHKNGTWVSFVRDLRVNVLVALKNKQLVIDSKSLRKLGGHAIWLNHPQQVVIRTVSQEVGSRPWTTGW